MRHIHRMYERGNQGIKVDGKWNSRLSSVQQELGELVLNFLQGKELLLDYNELAPSRLPYSCSVYSPERKIMVMRINPLPARHIKVVPRWARNSAVDYPVAPDDVIIQQVATYFDVLPRDKSMKSDYSRRARDQFLEYIEDK